MAQSDRPFTSPKANLGAYPSFTSTYHHKSYDAISPLNPHLSLQGKNVLITGGGSGIGRATVVAFAQAGASNVIITGRNGSKLEETRKAVTEAMSKEQNKSSNAQIHTFAADITDMAGMTKVFKTVAETIGAIDILINSAGYLAKPSGTIDMDIDENWLGVEINVKGTMIMVQTYLKHVAAMKIQDPIYINVSSGAAHVTFPSSGVYGAGKAAATRIMDYAQLNHPELRVFNLQPGIVKTPMSKKSNLQIPEEMWDDESLPAHFMVWLSSPEAVFLKGRFVFANWDVEEMKAKKKELEDDPNLLILTLGGWPFQGKAYPSLSGGNSSKTTGSE